MVTMVQRLSVATLLLGLILIVITETSANPGQEQHDVNSVADAIRYLQDLENRHQFARPRSRSTDHNEGISIHHLNENLIKLLEELDNKHSRTPRFGKRGNDYSTKEFTNNYLRYLLENSPQGGQVAES